jgi:hypothetical protein
MKARILVFLVLTLPILATAQTEKKQFIHKGILSAYLTLTPGHMLALKTNAVYLHGNMEYYFDNKISVRGDGFYYIDSLGYNIFAFNHSLFFGPSYHFKTSNHFDPYLSIQPGIAYTKDILFFGPSIIASSFAYAGRPASFNPLVSGTVGMNYYATRFFHLFLEGRFVQGKYRASDVPFSMNEVRLSFGLAFNLNTVKVSE